MERLTLHSNTTLLGSSEPHHGVCCALVGGLGLEQPVVRVRHNPACFGIYHCTEECLEVLRLGEEAVVIDKLQGRNISRTQIENGETNLVCHILEPLSTRSSQGEDKQNLGRREIVHNVLGQSS